ncbi:serine/threonine-protein kinase [Candidatus Uabimicrobium amorphum]|uniref:Protein kinase domain-containing protein n=1 Tax=Uabimicrobium amorphum TaxID=2596890 RepID=A0A5S9F3F0_UABAM|nr:serine/threonine-protein kinase [Candidatus Uabimicrobium amorphum]BBM84667.1 hypothetical protein UABAM_03028 [Candidatus Uabimicrobium amorphum]
MSENSKYSLLSSLQDISLKKPQIEWDEASRVIDKRYKILRMLGRGGQGIVWEVYDEVTKREVALKQCSAARDPRLFLEEVTLHASFHHESIPSIFEVHEGDLPYFTMRKIDGIKLSEFLHALHGLPNANPKLRMMVNHITLRELMHIFYDICRVVCHLHEKNYVHRDLKPQNILIDSEYKIHLIDFGLTTSPENVKEICGTKNFVDPRCLFETKKSKRIDIYALGVILLAMTTSRSYRSIEGDRWEFFPYDTNIDLRLSLKDFLKQIESLRIQLPACDKSLKRDVTSKGIERIFQHCLGIDRRGFLCSRTFVYPRAEDLCKDVESLLSRKDGIAFRQPLATKLSKLLRQYPKSVTAFLILIVFSVAVAMSMRSQYLHSYEEAEQALRQDNPSRALAVYQNYSWFYTREKKWLQEYMLFQKLLKNARFAFYNSYMIKPFYERLPFYDYKNMTQISRLLKLYQQIQGVTLSIEQNIQYCNPSVNYFFYQQNIAAQRKEITFLKRMAIFSGEYITSEKAQGILEDLNVAFPGKTNKYLELSVYFVTRNQKALKAFVEENPSLYWGHAVRAIQLLCEEKWNESQSVSLACVALDPKHFFPYLLVVLSSIEDAETAKKFLAKMNQFKEKNAYFYLLLGDIYFYHSMFVKAQEQYSAALNIDPSANAYFRLGNVQLSLQNFTAAIEDFSWAISISQQGKFYRQRGTAYLKNVAYQEAIDDFVQAIALEPNLSEGYIAKSLVHLAQKKYSAAMQDLGMAVRKNPQNWRGYIYRADIYILQEKHDLAIADLNKALQLQPNDVEIRRKRASVYAKQQQYNLAIADVNVVLQLNEKDVQSREIRGLCYLKKGNFEAAFRDFNFVINNHKSRASTYSHRGTTYMQQNRYALALADFDNATQLDKNYLPAYTQKVEIFVRLKEFTKAITVLDRLLNIQPDSKNFRYQRANVYVQQNRLTEAITDLNFLIENNAQDLEAYLQRGLVYLKQKMFVEALRDFQHITKNNSESEQGYYLSGIALSQMKKWKEASTSFDNAISLNDAYKEAIFHRGIAFLNLGVVEKAHRDFSKVFYIEKYRSSAYFYLACVYALQNKKMEACSLLEECLRSKSISIEQVQKEDKLRSIRKTTRYRNLMQRFGD